MSKKKLDSSQHVESPKRTDEKRAWTTSVKAVLWSFFGVRRKGGLEEDAQHLKPYPVIWVGLFMGILFVVALMLFVHWVAG